MSGMCDPVTLLLLAIALAAPVAVWAWRLKLRLDSAIAVKEDAESRLKSMAQHDPLTGLPNRLLIADRLSQAIYRAERQGRKVAVCFIDLIGFKKVNDDYGLDTGDALLAALGQRAALRLRATDSVGRLGGDALVLVLEDIDDADAALGLARDVQQLICEPMEVSGHSCSVTSSVGIAIYPDHGSNTPTLLRKADNAMYQAKRDGSGQVLVFAGD